ncbi:N-fatty-acyl-amino acid synthase/hydrolase PM20D1 isoform X4 [Rhinolophus sinicus]|uniref:N-fatty-acyl-amino acid synthase/hydrolase PM20D1 isoform X4 n=1 Tax=Rhinolophus sinicus TaxID=89399 RepID=UPI003D7BE4C3
MARPYVCVLTLAGLLLLGFATISRSKYPSGKERQRASRIPSQFSQEERVAMKEALKGAIQIPTVSFGPGKFNTTALADFGKYIRKAFPALFKTSFIQHEVVGEYSHLFTVQGSDPSLQPYMLLAHIDVVPASDQGWEVPPFSGLERDGFIHGRGTLDNKNSVMAILQALELLLVRKYIPRRSFLIALGHDEEVSGANGAQKISALLQARGTQIAFIVDEGGFILDNFIPNFKKPFAMVSVSEKGSINLMLQVNMTPGHSSAPPKETSIGILAAAVSRLEQTPVPNMSGNGPLKKLLQQLANEIHGEELHNECAGQDHYSSHHVQCRGQGKCHPLGGPGHSQFPDSPCTDRSRVFFQPHSNFMPFLRAVSSSWGFHLCRLWHSSLLSSPLPQWPSFPVHLMKALESLAPSCPPAQCGMESLHHPESAQHPLSRSLLSLVRQFRPSGTLPAGLRAMGTEPCADPAGK